jgi:hypothetical protein
VRCPAPASSGVSRLAVLATWLGCALGSGLAPGDTSGATALPAPATRRFTEITTPDFVLITPADEPQAGELAARLLTFRRALDGLLGAELRSPLPTTIFALDGDTWTRYAQPRPGMAGYFTSQPFAADLMFDASLPGPQPLELMLHEYTHHLLRALGPVRLPPFVDEGLAQVLGNARFAPRVIRFGLRPDHLALLRTSTWLPFGQLADVRRSDAHYLDDALARAFYAQSWATMYYVLSPEAGARQRLADYLQRLRSAPQDDLTGRDAEGSDDAAVAQLVGRPLERANAAISRFVLAREAPMEIVIRVPRERDAAPMQARRIGADEYDVRLGELLLRLGNRGTLARALLRGVAEDSPFAPRARVGAALAVLQSGDVDFATALLDAPEVAVGIDLQTGVQLGRGLLQLSLAGTPATAAARIPRLARAQELFAAALDAPCCWLEATQGYVLAMLAQQQPQPGLLARALKAYGAAPSNPELAAAVALVHESEGRPAQARAYWRAAARSLPPGPARARTLERLQLVPAPKGDATL